jgi:hypothetical protein
MVWSGSVRSTPYRNSEVVDHSRAVHPLALIKMSDLVSQLLSDFRLQTHFYFGPRQRCVHSPREGGGTRLADVPLRLASA